MKFYIGYHNGTEHHQPTVKDEKVFDVDFDKFKSAKLFRGLCEVFLYLTHGITWFDDNSSRKTK